MKPETAERIALAFDEAAKEASGGADLREAIAEIVLFLEGLLVQLRLCKSKEQVHEHLLAMDEPPAAMLALLVGTMRYSPRIITARLRSIAKGFIRAQAPTGRPAAIPPDTYPGICVEISAIELKGKSLGQAKRIVAKAHDVNWRTIHRIWSKREQYSHDGVTLKNAEAFISKLGM